MVISKPKGNDSQYHQWQKVTQRGLLITIDGFGYHGPLVYL
jgi:hypothetical protein